MSAILLFVVSVVASTSARSLQNDVQKKDLVPNKWSPYISQFPPDSIIGPDNPFKPVGPFGPFVVSRRDVIGDKTYRPPSNGYWEDPTRPSKPSGPFGPIVVSRRDVIKDKTDRPSSDGYWEDPFQPSKPSGPFGPDIASRGVDFDGEDVSVESLIELMTEVIDELKDDMPLEDLSDAAASVKYLADSLFVMNGGQASRQDVMKLILKIGAEIGNGDVDLSVLFDDPLKFEARTLNYALRLWVGLTNRLVQQNAEGTSVDTTLAAISFTADIIQNALRNTVRLMTDMVKGGDPPLTKRQNVNPNFSVSASKTFTFDNKSSLTFSGSVSTSDFQTVNVNVGVAFKF